MAVQGENLTDKVADLFVTALEKNQNRRTGAA